jgi:hypothetical protein
MMNNHLGEGYQYFIVSQSETYSNKKKAVELDKLTKDTEVGEKQLESCSWMRFSLND